jgi:hypothetical protein
MFLKTPCTFHNILTSLPNQFLFVESSSALECITVGDDPPWKNARIHAV